MPPARKTVCPYQIDSETAAKRPWPRHVVNIQDLRVNKNDNDKFHLVLKINEFSPEQISIKRSGNILQVDSKKKDENCEGEDGVEHITRSYQIPEGGYTEDFGAQISTDGLMGIRASGMDKMKGRVIPINIDRLPQLKPGTMFHLNTGEWQNTCPVKNTYLDKTGVPYSQNMEFNKAGKEKLEISKEEKKENGQLPGNDIGQEMKTGAEDSTQGGIPDDSV